MIKDINIGIAEDHYLLRQLLVNRLKETKGINVMFDVNNGRELFRKLYTGRPDVILLDIEMPVMSGKDIMQKLGEKYKDIKIIILTAHYNEEYMVKYINSGASAFLPKNCDFNEVHTAIRTVYQSGTYYDSHVMSVMKKYADADMHTEALTEAETAIARLLCNDQTVKEIAGFLKISVDSVYYHKQNIARKIKAKSPVALYKYCLEKKIIVK